MNVFIEVGVAFRALIVTNTTDIPRSTHFNECFKGKKRPCLEVLNESIIEVKRSRRPIAGLSKTITEAC